MKTDNNKQLNKPSSHRHPETVRKKEQPRTLEAALFYESIGFSVIPINYIRPDGSCSCGKAECPSPGKHPIGPWQSRAKQRLTELEITRAWLRHPLCNVGIVTGEISGIDSIDIDGAAGIKSLQQQLGMTLEEMPVTPMVATPGGGFHLYYRHKRNLLMKTRSKVLDHVDTRSELGLVVAPPSIHRNGKAYKWVEGRSLRDVPIGEFDFSRLFKPRSTPEPSTSELPNDQPQAKPRWYLEALEGVAEGNRNDTAVRLAGRYLHLGLGIKETRLLMGAWNKLNSPPMEDKELAATIKSIYEKEKPEQEISKPDLLDSISSILRLSLRSVRVIRSDDSSSTKVELVFDEGTCNISNTDLLNPLNFQKEIAAATGRMIKKMGSRTQPTHEQFVQMILDAAEITIIDESATEKGETLSFIRQYVTWNINQHEICDVKDAPERGCFRYDHVIWIDLHDLCMRMNNHIPHPMSRKNLAVRFESLGLEKREFNGRMRYGITYEMAEWKETDLLEYDERQATKLLPPVTEDNDEKH